MSCKMLLLSEVFYLLISFLQEAYSVARQFNMIPPVCEQAEYHLFQREKVEVQLPELYHKIGETDCRASQLFHLQKEIQSRPTWGSAWEQHSPSLDLKGTDKYLSSDTKEKRAYCASDRNRC